jgi:homoserine acetyltransferase
MDADPFINALADVDILKVEAVGRVVGRSIGAVRQGMIDASVPEDAANAIIQSAIEAAWAEIMKMANNPGDDTT